MSITKRQIRFISLVALLTTFLTLFFYAHESLPKPLRAATAIIETPVAIASGLSYYLNLQVDVYETPWLIVLTNFIFSVIMVLLVDKLLRIRKRKLTGQIDNK